MLALQSKIEWFKQLKREQRLRMSCHPYNVYVSLGNGQRSEAVLKVFSEEPKIEIKLVVGRYTLTFDLKSEVTNASIPEDYSSNELTLNTPLQSVVLCFLSEEDMRSFFQMIPCDLPGIPPQRCSPSSSLSDSPDSGRGGTHTICLIEREDEA